MKIVIISFDEPFYIPDLFSPLFNVHSRDIKGIIIVPPKPKSKSFIAFIKDQIEIMGPKVFTLRLLLYLKEQLLIALNLSKRSLAKVSEAYKIKSITSPSINGSETKNFLKKIKPDLVIAQVPEKISPEILKLAKFGFVNKHASLLPKYKGLYPVFWSMLNKEKNAGFTFHFMTNEIDQGKILFQRKVRIEKKDTVDTLYKKIFVLAGNDLSMVVNQIKNGKFKTRAMKKTKDYYRFPNKASIKKFRKLGFSF